MEIDLSLVLSLITTILVVFGFNYFVSNNHRSQYSCIYKRISDFSQKLHLPVNFLMLFILSKQIKIFYPPDEEDSHSLATQ